MAAAKNPIMAKMRRELLAGEGQRFFSNSSFCLGYLAEMAFDQSGSGLWHLRVAEGDHLSERSE